MFQELSHKCPDEEGAMGSWFDSNPSTFYLLPLDTSLFMSGVLHGVIYV